MLRVFEFSYENNSAGGYCGGILLVAAKNLEQAEITINNESDESKYWIYKSEHTELSCNWLRPGIITSYTYIE